MMKSAQYHAYARECLNLAEEAEPPDARKSPIELSHAWMQTALTDRSLSILAVLSGSEGAGVVFTDPAGWHDLRRAR
jgi:hypothetical protein